MKKPISVIFSVIFFAIPLFFFTKTSELFEFNKIIILYSATALITTLWIVECILEKKFVFKRTLLDIPLLFFLGTELISTIFSIEPHTSLFGYYSRFNGGLISIVSYSLLYWAFVTHMNYKDVRRFILNIFAATALASIWGAFEHFGKSPSCLLITGNFDVSCWVQDVKLRVFATFGQPNWMAAWVVSVLPLTYGLLTTKSKLKSKQFLLHFALSGLFLSALLFTKSRSGILAFGITYILFWLAVFSRAFYNQALKIKEAKLKTLQLVGISLFFAFLVLVFGSPWTPTFTSLLNRQRPTSQEIKPTGPALETGGTESGEIRKIVWEGAINVWREFPIFGSGVETFAMSYYRGRPVAHNLTSEWNFLYNKAHNEYLNYLATTGIVGLGGYLVFLGACIFIFVKGLKFSVNNKNGDIFILEAALFCGFISILITNFFGFSVVSVSLLTFLFPAFSFSLLKDNEKEDTFEKHLDSAQLVGISLVSIVGLFLLLQIFNYWRADYLFAKAHSLEDSSDFVQSINYYKDAISLSPNESLYHADLASMYGDIASATIENKTTSLKFEEASIEQIREAQALSPNNVRVLKSVANSYATLGDINSNYISKTIETSEAVRALAPTDPSPLYQESLALAKLGKFDAAQAAGEAAIALKPDYKIARRLLAFLYKETKNNDKAREQLNYILKYISPEDKDIKTELENIK